MVLLADSGGPGQTVCFGMARPTLKPVSLVNIVVLFYCMESNLPLISVILLF